MKFISRVIESYLNKRGFYRSDMPEGAVVTEAEVLEMFRTYGENEMFLRFLRDLCARDIRLHFNATTDRDRAALHGAHSRTNYFISLVKKANDKRRQ